jgi:hypothetical protein
LVNTQDADQVNKVSWSLAAWEAVVSSEAMSVFGPVRPVASRGLALPPADAAPGLPEFWGLSRALGEAIASYRGGGLWWRSGSRVLQAVLSKSGKV